MEDIKSVLLQSFIMNIVTGIMCLLTMILSCFTFFGDRAERKQFQRQQQVVAPV
jgi:hypothetical protein